MRKYTLVAVGLLGLLAACTSVVPASVPPLLAGTSWVVTRLASGPTLPDHQPTLAFSGDGRLSGSTGCNSITGDYTLSDSTLTIGTIGSTLKLCLDAGVGEQETAFLQALGAVTSVRTAGDGVELLDAGGTVVATLAPVAPASLEGTTWSLTGVIQNEAVATPVADAAVTLTFSDGSLAGKACNSFRGSATIEGSNLTVGPLATTRMFCAGEGVMDQENLVLEILGKASTFRLDGDVLVISGADGRGLQFTAG